MMFPNLRKVHFYAVGPYLSMICAHENVCWKRHQHSDFLPSHIPSLDHLCCHPVLSPQDHRLRTSIHAILFSSACVTNNPVLDAPFIEDDWRAMMVPVDGSGGSSQWHSGTVALCHSGGSSQPWRKWISAADRSCMISAFNERTILERFDRTRMISARQSE